MTAIPLYLQYIIIMILGVINGAIGVLIGGVSIITIPALILIGLSPHVAIATNRVGLLGMILAGLYELNKQKLINYRLGLLIGIMALLGSIVGAHCVLGIEARTLRMIVAIFSALLLIVLLFNPNRGMVKEQKTMTKRHYILGGLLSLLLGAYGGFYGAGVATFFSYLLVFLYGETFVQSTGTRNIPMLLLSVVTSMIFIQNKVVDFGFAGALFVSMGLGGYLAARHVQVIGDVWLKRMFMGLAVVMIMMLFL
jgi:uncharacterized membrane protein YfcA